MSVLNAFVKEFSEAGLSGFPSRPVFRPVGRGELGVWYYGVVLYKGFDRFVNRHEITLDVTPDQGASHARSVDVLSHGEQIVPGERITVTAGVLAAAEDQRPPAVEEIFKQLLIFTRNDRRIIEFLSDNPDAVEDAARVLIAAGLSRLLVRKDEQAKECRRLLGYGGYRDVVDCLVVAEGISAEDALSVWLFCDRDGVPGYCKTGCFDGWRMQALRNPAGGSLFDVMSNDEHLVSLLTCEVLCGWVAEHAGEDVVERLRLVASLTG